MYFIHTYILFISYKYLCLQCYSTIYSTIEDNVAVVVDFHCLLTDEGYSTVKNCQSWCNNIWIQTLDYETTTTTVHTKWKKLYNKSIVDVVLSWSSLEWRRDAIWRSCDIINKTHINMYLLKSYRKIAFTTYYHYEYILWLKSGRFWLSKH